MSVAYRLNRLFHARSGRCIDVAMDHGFAGEPRFLEGIEDMRGAVAAVAAAGPDAIQLTPGQAPLLQALPGRDKPALVLRVDIANVYAPDPPPAPFSRLFDDAIGHARAPRRRLRLRQPARRPGPARAAAPVRREHRRLREAACDRVGMPLMVEPLVMQARRRRLRGRRRRRPHRRAGAPGGRAGRRPGQGRPDRRPPEYRRVVAAGRVPVLVRGGGRVPDTSCSTHARGAGAGRRGIVYGRNVIQHPDPTGWSARCGPWCTGATPRRSTLAAGDAQRASASASSAAG